MNAQPLAQTNCAQIRQSRVLLKPKILIQKYLYNADYLCSISASTDHDLRKLI